MKKVGPPILILSLVLAIGLMTYGQICTIQFQRGCSAHLKRAADSNTIELAAGEMRIAVDYIESAGLNTGDTSVLYTMPNCELDFWHKNLKAALDELESTPDDVDQLTVSNQLLKLRETIVDHREKGDRVTLPPNVRVYPNQAMYRSLGFVSVMGMLIGGTGTMMRFDQTSESKEKQCETSDDGLS